MWLLIALLVLIAIVVAQNSAVVSLRFLFWEASLSRVVLLLLTLAIGIMIGFIGAKMLKGRQRGE
ncbi:MAG: lipopolysaccharide assembly protein LapA domain-containing protein [Candidatus Krumholzibacteria bacterium]|nr:lipopolysaccharide assembly protein LapA domain-containing protein [Candidatus Krumholzibacteria bacterium]